MGRTFFFNLAQPDGATLLAGSLGSGHTAATLIAMPLTADATEPTGYAHPAYCASLSELGTPLLLPTAGAYLLERSIGNTALRDAMAPYPLLVCNDWTCLADDLQGLAGELVSVTAVTDPLGKYDEDILRAAFPDLMRPYKEHFIVDLSMDPHDRISRHHLRNVRRAQQKVVVEHSSQPGEWLDDWVTLYRLLVRRWQIEGIALFSRRSFELQFGVPGLHVFRASMDGTAIGMLLWYVQGERAYYHLGSYSDEGYRTGAAFALFQAAIDWFSKAGCRTLLLGAGAGESDDGTDGLSRFKRGWATGTATAYLCGRILDREAYDRLCPSAHTGGFFPPYRGQAAQLSQV